MITVTRILTATDVHAHAIRRHGDLVRAHLAAVGQKVHTIDVPLFAEVNHGRWIAYCECDSGVSLDPQGLAGRCFECGAVYTVVVYPRSWREVERALLARPHMKTRNWRRDESVTQLLQENLTHGIGV